MQQKTKKTSLDKLADTNCVCCAILAVLVAIAFIGSFAAWLSGAFDHRVQVGECYRHDKTESLAKVTKVEGNRSLDDVHLDRYSKNAEKLPDNYSEWTKYLQQDYTLLDSCDAYDLQKLKYDVNAIILYINNRDGLEGK